MFLLIRCTIVAFIACPLHSCNCVKTCDWCNLKQSQNVGEKEEYLLSIFMHVSVNIYIRNCRSWIDTFVSVWTMYKMLDSLTFALLEVQIQPLNLALTFSLRMKILYINMNYFKLILGCLNMFLHLNRISISLIWKEWI